MFVFVGIQLFVEVGVEQVLVGQVGEIVLVGLGVQFVVMCSFFGEQCVKFFYYLVYCLYYVVQFWCVWQFGQVEEFLLVDGMGLVYYLVEWVQLVVQQLVVKQQVCCVVGQ